MSAPINTLSPSQQPQEDEWQKNRNFWIIYGVVIRFVAIVILMICRNYAPNATPADFWTFLAIIFIPELYILWKLFKWISGAQCTSKAESSYLRQMRAKYGTYETE